MRYERKRGSKDVSRAWHLSTARWNVLRQEVGKNALAEKVQEPGLGNGRLIRYAKRDLKDVVGWI